MTTAALVFVVLVLLTFGIMLVRAAGARPSHQQLDSARRQAEEKGNALLRSWLTPEQDSQWLRDRAFEVTGCDTGNRYRITDSPSMNVLQLGPSGHTVAKWFHAKRKFGQGRHAPRAEDRIRNDGNEGTGGGQQIPGR
jgi:hypothetical protein